MWSRTKIKHVDYPNSQTFAGCNWTYHIRCTRFTNSRCDPSLCCLLSQKSWFLRALEILEGFYFRQQCTLEVVVHAACRQVTTQHGEFLNRTCLWSWKSDGLHALQTFPVLSLSFFIWGSVLIRRWCPNRDDPHTTAGRQINMPPLLSGCSIDCQIFWISLIIGRSSPGVKFRPVPLFLTFSSIIWLAREFLRSNIATQNIQLFRCSPF